MHNCVVLSEFGCDLVHNNPPRQVITIFNEAIKKYPIKYVFFAIKPKKNPLTKKQKDSIFYLFHEKIDR